MVGCGVACCGTVAYPNACTPPEDGPGIMQGGETSPGRISVALEHALAQLARGGIVPTITNVRGFWLDDVQGQQPRVSVTFDLYPDDGRPLTFRFPLPEQLSRADVPLLAAWLATLGDGTRH